MAATQACTRASFSSLQATRFSCECRPSSTKSLLVRSISCRQAARELSSIHHNANGVLLSVHEQKARKSIRAIGTRASGMSVSFGDQGKHEAKFQKGDKVKVCQSAIVYHVPKTPQLDLQNLEGEVADVLYEFKGKPISANLPYKVKFEKEGKPFFAHLREDEIELAS
jgi:hypothetical protein